MKITVRLPGSVDLQVGPVEGEINLMAPVCTLSQDKWAAPYIITDSLLEDCDKEIEYHFTVQGVRGRLHAFGKRIEGAGRYIGCYLHRFDGQRKEVHVRFISYRYEWNHDPACNKKHTSMPKAEDLLALGFQRPPEEPTYSVNWAECFDFTGVPSERR